ncbi:MAG: isopenicillin N synthase family oxygenase [Acidimicrobiales bacterium]|nr:isopenicillin N synthase family oxygenase [Acidimicrobiales bacterium]
MATIPVIDVAPARRGERLDTVGRAIDAACREVGFVTIVGHGIAPAVVGDLTAAAQAFFALPDATKATIAMPGGGRAWRGWFPLGAELTAGRPDGKEGIYFGTDLPADDPRVRAGTPLHGPNRYPAEPPGMRRAVEAYLAAVTALGQDVLRAMAVGLGLDADWFVRELTADPLVLFRIFRYPPVSPGALDETWSVGEHTDYGLITLLPQDDADGLEVHGPAGWIAVPSRPGAFVVNLGDMLERMTRGRWVSTSHRVRNLSGRDRLAFPLFLDPGWDVEVPIVPGLGAGATDAAARWDGQAVTAWDGTYGSYVLDKVAKVFPELAAEVQ